MPSSPRTPLATAVAVALAATGIWVTAFRTAAGARLDATIMTGFLGLPVARLATAVAHLADPAPFALATAAIVGVALLRRRPWLAGMALVVIVGANVTTQALKRLTAEPRLADALSGAHVDAASWPSGHATAAATIALCAVVVAAPRWRPLASVVGGVYAIGVGSSVLVLGWHLPSDVLGAFCVAAAWTLLGSAAVTGAGRRISDVSLTHRASRRLFRRLRMAFAGRFQ